MSPLSRRCGRSSTGSSEPSEPRSGRRGATRLPPPEDLAIADPPPLPIACPECGTELPAAARFCFNCGHQLQAGAVASTGGRPARDVTSEIAQRLRDTTQATGERRTITILFCDVVGSTAAAERLDPEDWADVMRGLFARMIAPVERYGGTVARLLGDAILAYFGAPVAHEDDPERALLAALEIRDGSRAAAAEAAARHGIDVDVRIGINTGLVVVGEVGSDLLGEYAALGDAANVAARMEQTAAPGTIRVAAATHRLTATRFEFAEVGAVPVKGKSEPVPAHELVRPDARPGRQRGIAGLHAPMVGRDAELRRLRQALKDLQAGRGSIVSVVGEAGLGKSRLAAEFRAEATADGARWLEGASLSYEAATPYTPFARILRGAFALDAGEDPADRYRRLVEGLAALGLAEPGRHAAHLSTVLDLAPSAEDQGFLRYLEPPQLRERAFASVQAVAEAFASAAPLVLTIEDLHWADPASLDLTQALFATATRVPLLLLVLLRPNRDEPAWQLHEEAQRTLSERHITIELVPLDADGSRDLVASLLRVEGLTDRLRQLILDKSEGNPFFLEEVIRSLLDRGAIVPADGRYVATTELDDLEVPDTLAGLLTSRLDALDPHTRSVAQAAAVVGRQFPVDVLEQVVDGAADLAPALAELQRRELIHERRRTPDHLFAFKHALTHDTAYGTLLVSRRRDLHRRIGELVEQRHPEWFEDLARHFLEADAPRRALPYLVAAGDRALGAYAVDDAIGSYRRALEVWADGDDLALARRAYEGLGGALGFRSDVAGAIDTFEQMRGFADEHDDPATRVSALNKLGMWRAMGLGELERAEQELLEAKELAERIDDLHGVAEFHVNYCMVNVTAGRLEAAAEHLGEAARVCADLDVFHRNFGLTHFASTQVYLGRFDAAEEALEVALEQARIDGDLVHTTTITGWLRPMMDLFRGRPAEGLAAARAGTDRLLEIGALRDAIGPMWTAAVIALELGRYEEAGRLFEDTTEISARAGMPWGVAAGTAGQATVHQALHGRGTSEVRELLSGARTILGYPTGTTLATWCLGQMALAALIEGEVDFAGECCDLAAETPSASRPLAAPEALLCASQVALERRDPDRGAQLVAEAEAHVRAHGLLLYEPRLRLARAQLDGAAGDVAGAERQLRAGEDLARPMKALHALRLVQLTAVDLLERAGRDEEAAGFRERLAATLSDIAGTIESGELRTAFLHAHALVG